MSNKVWTEEEIIRLQNIALMMDVRQFSSPVTTHEDGSIYELGELIPDNKPSPEELVLNEDRRNDLLRYIDKLPPRQCKVIKMRYGFENGHFMTLEQIGKIFNVSRERVRQIECKAIRLLREMIINKDKCKNLNDF